MLNLSFHVTHYGDNTFTIAAIGTILNTERRLGFISIPEVGQLDLSVKPFRINHKSITPREVIDLYKRTYIPIKEEVLE